MLVLAVDTAGQTGGVLLARNERASSQFSETDVLGTRALEPRKFSTQLISAIAELLRLNGAGLVDLDVVAVVSGPGSFTGLRVGLSAVKAMAEVAAKPIVSVSRLAVMALAAETGGLEPFGDQSVHTVLDAGRGEFYHGIYRDAGRMYVAESLQTATGLRNSFERTPGVAVASEPMVLDALTGMNARPCAIPEVTVREALPLVFAAWQARRFTDVALLDANYLRRAHPVMGTNVNSVSKSVGIQVDRP